MASRTVHDCDRCGRQDIGPDPIRIDVAIGTRRDLPSGRSEDACRTVHLCNSCAGETLDMFINVTWRSEDRRRWAAGLKPAATS